MDSEQLQYTYKQNMWRQRALPFALLLRERVNALKGRFYMGCGFHYSLEDSASHVLHLLAVPFVVEDWTKAIIARVVLESLADRVARAEESTVREAALLKERN